MDSLIFEAPSNSLSFGNVSLNLLREMYKKKLKVAFFPIGGDLDLGAYDSLEEDFSKWIKSSFNSRFSLLKKDVPTLKLWHLNGSHIRIGSKQTLYTFYEASSPTPEELNIANFQDHVVFSSSYASEIFSKAGVENCTSVPCGFDPDFKKTNKTYLADKTHFGLMGKWEKRKHTAEIIKAWAKKYGNNYNYQLSCCVTNPFFKPQDMNSIISRTLDGKRFGNINFLPYLKTNSEVNDFINSIDIDLSGLSGAEGWNLPAFNSTCLGKWSLVLNCTSHKDWATKDNCILVEPDGTEEIYDNTFFQPNQPFNQGFKYTISEEKIISSMEKAVSQFNIPNKEGELLRDKFTYSKTLNSLLNLINV